MPTLEFSGEYSYDSTPDGILIPVQVALAEKTVDRTAGSFIAHGHEVTLPTLELEWNAVVYFYAAATRQNNFLGRRGWLDRVRLGLVHHDQQIYLSGYSRPS